MITIVYTQNCPFCVMAKNLLNAKNIEYTWIDYTGDFDKIAEISGITWMRTVPQIFSWEISKENLIWGYSELQKLEDEWKL